MSDFPNPNADRTKNRAHKPDPAEIAEKANGKAADDPVKPKGNAAACPRPVRGRVAICLMLPHRDDATAGIGSGLCAQCAALPPAEPDARIGDAMRLLWPGVRPIGAVSREVETVR